MSAIAGVLNLDSQPVSRRDLERMASSLAAYGPDRTEVLVAGAIGFAHAQMRVTPEDRLDRQPMRGSTGVLMTADLRLDNRDEILERLGINRASALGWADSRVLLAAWEKFGNSIWSTLRGPFAVAIWNPRDRTLTLARDHLGLNSIVWHKSNRFFAFATMPKGLFALSDVPRELNEEKLADFLVLNHNVHETTIYRSINRLPPAHFATIDANGTLTAKRYWSTADIKPIRLASDDAYAEGLGVVLDRAVRRQLRSAYPVGSYLSGGLDSSAVAALAARALGEKGERLTAFTEVPRKDFDGQVPELRYADETPYVEAIKKQIGNIDVTYVYNNEHDDFAELDRVNLAFEFPVRNPTNLGWMLAICRLARSQNRRVLLAGDHGNFTISWDGWSQSSRHLLRGRLALAYRQYWTYYRSTAYSHWTAFRRLFINPLLSGRMLDWEERWRGKTERWSAYSAIRPEFAAEMQVKERGQKAGHDFRYRMTPGDRLAAVELADYLGEWYTALKAMYGVETRIPVADIDVVEYCIGIPEEQFLADGIDRSLIRRAMWGLLPAIVLTNRRKGMQSADWFEKMSARRERLKAEVDELAASPLASRAVDVERLKRALDTWPSTGWHTSRVRNEYQLALSRGISAGRFLRWFEGQNR
jgi:asparagine synthase (glutamine-hydrolysing)